MLLRLVGAAASIANAAAAAATFAAIRTTQRTTAALATRIRCGMRSAPILIESSSSKQWCIRWSMQIAIHASRDRTTSKQPIDRWCMHGWLPLDSFDRSTDQDRCNIHSHIATANCLLAGWLLLLLQRLSTFCAMRCTAWGTMMLHHHNHFGPHDHDHCMQI